MSGPFRQAGPDGEIFQAYVGPFATLAEACRVRWRAGRPATWPKHLGLPSTTYCLCLEEVATLPPLRAAPLGRADRFRVSDVQQLLFAHRMNEDLRIDGTFDAVFQRNLMSYQRERGIPATGVLDGRTWRTVVEDGC